MQHFVHFYEILDENGRKTGKKRFVFPRYHQLAAVQQHQVATQARLDALLPAILDRAFKGEL